MKMAYFDNSATSNVEPQSPGSNDSLLPGEVWQRASLHSLGRIAEEAMTATRGNVAEAINTTPEEVIFTAGGTESDNMALQGYAYANRKRGNLS